MQEQQRNLEPYAPKAVHAPVIQLTGLLKTGWNQQQQLSQMSGCPTAKSRQEIPCAGGPARLPLPKLKSVVRPESHKKQRIANEMVSSFEDTSSQMSKRTDLSSSTKSPKLNSTGLTQGNQVDGRSYSADFEDKAGNNKLSGKVFPKLKLLDRVNFFKRNKDVDKTGQGHMESRHSSASLLSTSEEYIADAASEEYPRSQILDVKYNLTYGPDPKVCTQQEREAGGSCQQEPSNIAASPLEVEVKQACGALGVESHSEVSRFGGFVQQIRTKLPTQDDVDQHKEEEGGYEGGDLDGPEKVEDGRGEAEEGKNVEAAMTTSSSAGTTPGLTLNKGSAMPVF